jgi:hypothetical protein
MFVGFVLQFPVDVEQVAQPTISSITMTVGAMVARGVETWVLKAAVMALRDLGSPFGVEVGGEVRDRPHGCSFLLQREPMFQDCPEDGV